MRRKLMSLIMVISVAMCTVGCGSNNANEVSTAATTEQTTTQETIVAETTECVKEETTTAKTYDYPTTVEEAEKEFGFTAEEAKKFMINYFNDGNFMKEYPTIILQHFDVDSDNVYVQSEYQKIRNWTYLYYDAKIASVSNNNYEVDEIEMMYAYNDYLTNGIFTFDTVYDDGSEVGDLTSYLYYRALRVGRATSDEEALEIYDFTIEEAHMIIENYKQLSDEERAKYMEMSDKVISCFDTDKNGTLNKDEFGDLETQIISTYNSIGDCDNAYDDFEWMNMAYDMKFNKKLLHPYFLPNGEKWVE